MLNALRCECSTATRACRSTSAMRNGDSVDVSLGERTHCNGRAANGSERRVIRGGRLSQRQTTSRVPLPARDMGARYADEVAYSSRLIAAARAAESEREDALFVDPFAEALAGAPPNWRIRMQHACAQRYICNVRQPQSFVIAIVACQVQARKRWRGAEP